MTQSDASLTKQSLTEQLDSLFNPHSIAVVGASEHYGKWGFSVFHRVLMFSSGRKVYPINGNGSEVFGVKSYKSVKELPEMEAPIDLVVMVIPRDKILSAMRDCVERRVRNVLIITAGFSEMDKQGAEIEAEMVQIARSGNIRLMGPNCMGHINTASGLVTMALGPIVERGHIGLITQSGNIGANITQYGMDAGLGFSKVISSGNEADLCLEDFLEYLAEDEETRVIAVYIEGLRQADRFLKLAHEITSGGATKKRKPIVVIKAGRSMGGARAVKSHTFALAGTDTVNDAAFKQAGVIRVESVTELVDVAGALLRLPLPRGKRVGLVTGGGGFGVIAADTCEKLGLEIASLSSSTISKLNTILPSYWSHSNPIDMGGTGLPIYPCLETMIESEDIDAIISLSAIGVRIPIVPINESAPPHLWEKVEQILKSQEEEDLTNLDLALECMDKYQKPIIISLAVSEIRQRSLTFKRLHERGMMVYPSPERAVKVLAHLSWYSEYLNCRGCRVA